MSLRSCLVSGFPHRCCVEKEHDRLRASEAHTARVHRGRQDRMLLEEGQLEARFYLARVVVPRLHQNAILPRLGCCVCGTTCRVTHDVGVSQSMLTHGAAVRGKRLEALRGKEDSLCVPHTM